jgi:6-pyruvoyl-tetrahydropterin synthase related domain
VRGSADGGAGDTGGFIPNSSSRPVYGPCPIHVRRALAAAHGSVGVSPRRMSAVGSPSPPPGATGDGESVAAPETTAAPAVAPGTTDAPSAARATGWRARLRRLDATLFAPTGLEPSNPSGLREPDKPETMAYMIALVIGVLTAVLVENAMQAYPVPSGGDPGEWIATSFPFVGLPYPSWIIPGQYPPLLFPILGLFVRLFGPLQAGRAYVAFAAIFLGLSTYFLARSLVRSRAVALAAQALAMLNPTLIQSYFWGIYPNLLGLIFMNLALAFLLRFVRSGSPRHAFLFWVATAATILSHSLVAVVLGGTLLIVLLFLVWQHKLPRAIYRSTLSLLGFGVLVLSVGGYYILTKIAKIPHNNYLQTNAFAYVRNGLGQMFSLLLNPYFPGIHGSVATAEFSALALTALLVLALAGLRLLTPRRLSVSVLLVLAMLATVVGGAVLGWELSIVTDYSRFGFFLIIPGALGAGLLLDWVLHWVPTLRRPAGPRIPGALRPRTLPPRGAPWRGGTPNGWSTFGTAVLAIVFVLLLANTAFVTAAELPSVEYDNSASDHDPAYLRALNDIRTSGISGNAFALAGAAKWIRALLDRNAYSPYVASRYAFDPSHLNEEEITYFAMVAQDTVTNNLVASTIAGTNASVDNQTPDYEASFFGLFTPVASIIPANVSVSVTPPNNHTQLHEFVTAGPEILGPSTDTPAMELVYVETGFNLTISIVLAASAPSARFVYTFVADPGWLVQTVHANITGAPLTSPLNQTDATNFKGTAVPGALVLSPNSGGGSLQTFANVTPSSSVGKVQTYNRGPLVARAPITLTSGAKGAPSLNFSVVFSTPGAENLISNLPAYIDTPTVWANWSIRFMVLSNNSQFVANHPSPIDWEIPYLEAEYGARILAVESDASATWTDVLLPPAT